LVDRTCCASAADSAYRQGLLHGLIAGMTPQEQDAAGYRESMVFSRMSEMGARLSRPDNLGPFWPWPFPGGWSIPPDIPDPAALWPEVDGWPVPPPHLRGQGYERQ
jgi:hypothetical protein